MFTLEQIKTAQSKMKSGADFPAYIKEIKQMGVTNYETNVSDGHTDYFGVNDYKSSTTARYDALPIAATPQTEKFKADLMTHQQGKTDFMTFCNDCAKSGIEKWAVSMNKLTCTYFDKEGNEILMEKVPAL